MKNPEPIVMTWHNSAGLGQFIDPVSGSETAQAATQDARLASLPSGSKYILFRDLGPTLDMIPNGNYGMSYRDWVDGALDPTHAMNLSTIAYMDAFFGAITERVDFIFFDYEKMPSYFNYFKGLGANGTHVISSITWSGGIATVTTATAHGMDVGDFSTINGSVSTTGNYNGYWGAVSVPTSTSFTFAITADGGTYTGDSGTLYGGVDGRDRHMQDVFDNAASIANLPATLAAPAIDGSNFRVNPDPSDSEDTLTQWDWWVTRQRQRQLRYMIIDRAEAQLGYRPRCSNYQDIWIKWSVADRANGLNFSKGVSSVSSPSLYFGAITGSRLTGTDRQKMFQHFLIKMGWAESMLSSGNGELIPWVGTDPTGATESLRALEAQLSARMWLHLYELGVRKFLWFNPDPHTNAGTSLIEEVINETIPATRFNPKALNRVSLSDTFYTSGNVTTTLEWFESI